MKSFTVKWDDCDFSELISRTHDRLNALWFERLFKGDEMSEEDELKAWEEETERLRAESLARSQSETVQQAVDGVNNVIEARGLKLLDGIRGWCVVSITPPRRIILKDAPLTAAVEFALRYTKPE